jgi:hypothetical protein
MDSAIDQFNISINRVRDLIAIYQSLQSQATNALDLSDILRAALVLAVSALDYYVHEVVRLGMLEIHRGSRSEPNIAPNSSQSAFSRFTVSLGSASEDRKLALDLSSWITNDLTQNQTSDFINNPQDVSTIITAIADSLNTRLNANSWLENEIRERHSYLSFQQPDKIAEAIRLISDKKLWQEVANIMGKKDKEIKQQLSAIVDRRNKIAHEADIDPGYSLGRLWNIDEILVNDAVNFLDTLVQAIHQVVA